MAPPQGQQSNISNNQDTRRLYFAIIAVLIIVPGLVISILSILNILPGFWFTILSLSLAVVGVVLTLLQWLLPLPPLTSFPRIGCVSVPRLLREHWLALVLTIVLTISVIINLLLVSRLSSQGISSRPGSQAVGRLIINDPLSDKHSSQWPELVTKDGTCLFNDDVYHVALLNMYLHDYKCLAKSFTGSDFAFQVQMTIIKGIEGGIVFRVDSKAEYYYFFYLRKDGSYVFGKGDPTILPDHYVNLHTSSDPIIEKGLYNPNLIVVVASGHTIDLSVNKKHLYQTTDSSYSQGGIGFAATFGPGGTTESGLSEVVFSNAKVWDYTST